MTINWARIERASKPAIKTYTPEQIKAAVAAVDALPALDPDGDPNKVATFWPQPKQMPTIADVDFRDISTSSKVAIKSLFASNNTLKRDKLTWAVQNPGKSHNPSVFTQNPMVGTGQDGNIIVDGHHRLAALQLRGDTQATCWLLPMDAQITGNK